MDSSQALLQRRNQVMGAGAPLFYDPPLHIVRGDGAYLFDAQGRRYVDMYNNVPVVGHANPRVVEALSRQAATLNVHSRYLHEGVVAFAERLVSLHGPGIEAVIYSCTGTEASEVALRMARFATGRRGIVCSNATYHGNSELVGSLTHLVNTPQDPKGEIQAFPYPEKYRPLEPGLSEGELCELYLRRLDDAIGRCEASGAGFAALIVCPIFANEGLPEIPAGFMARAAERVRKAGGLLIADEVQSGYGRTGKWWGYEAAVFQPDIVVMGKPMGNGLPLAATAASRDLVEGFRARTRYFNTFAANPVQAAVGMAVLDEIEDRRLLSHVAGVGAELKAALVRHQTENPWIGDVRGEGLFLGIEIVEPGELRRPALSAARRLTNLMKERGFLTSNAGAFGNVVKIRPPLVFSGSDAAAFLQAWDAEMAGFNG